MTRFATLFICLLSVSINSYALQIAGDDAYAPYSYSEGGKAKGVYTEIVNEALKRMGENHSLTLLPWKRGLMQLKNNELDMLYPPYFRPEQRPYMEYSTPILEETLVIFCSKDKAASLTTFPDSYKGIKLGRNAGFATGKAVDKAVKNGLITVSEAKGMQANLKKLIAGRIDCYANDRLSILAELKKMKTNRQYDGTSIVETHVLTTENGYIGFNKKAKPETKAFILRFNKVIEEMKASGEIDKIVQKYTN